MEMDQLVALCKRRGFLFQSSEIYGGLQGFWDYGPLGVELKRNVREAWWRDMVTAHNELEVPPGAPSAYEMAGLDCSIIMHPQVWKCSGHYDLFHDFMVDCRESKRRYRYDAVEKLAPYDLAVGWGSMSDQQVLDKLSISPLDYASPGVYIKQSHVTADSAELEITTTQSPGTSKEALITCMWPSL